MAAAFEEDFFRSPALAFGIIFDHAQKATVFGIDPGVIGLINSR